LDKKKFGQKINFLAHSENFKPAENYILPYILPLWAKNIGIKNQITNWGQLKNPNH
jgi:hypothetical protein